MIRFLKLRYKNFLSTGNAFIEIDFLAARTTLFIGKNGTGKSTFMDALCFVLFKKPYREINLPQLVNTKNEKNCVVEVEFESGTSQYLVRRGSKPALFEIFHNGTLLNQPGSTRDYQETLERHILGLNFKSFSQIVILGPAKFKPFMRLPAADRRIVIDDVLDIQIFTTMSVIAKQQLSETKKRLSAIESKREGLEYAYKSLQETLAKLNPQETLDAKTLQKEIAEKSKLIVEHMAVANNLQEKLDAKIPIVATQKSANDLALRQLYGERVRLEQVIGSNKEHVQFYLDNETCPTCNQVLGSALRKSQTANTSQQIVYLHKELKGIESSYKACTKEQGSILALEEECSTLINEKHLLRTTVTELKGVVARLEGELVRTQSHDKLVADTKQHLGRVHSELRGLDDEKCTLLADRDYQEAACVLLKDTGMKARLLREYVPVINTQINKYLQALDLYVGFHLDENFDETIKSRHRDEFSYGSFSMGQQMRIDLAILFTWRDVARMRNSVNTNLLIMDEIFDSSLDDDGTDMFLKIMETVSREMQVFVVSHKVDALLDKFDRVKRFELKKDFTVMS